MPTCSNGPLQPASVEASVLSSEYDSDRVVVASGDIVGVAVGAPVGVAVGATVVPLYEVDVGDDSLSEVVIGTEVAPYSG